MQTGADALPRPGESESKGSPATSPEAPASAAARARPKGAMLTTPVRSPKRSPMKMSGLSTMPLRPITGKNITNTVRAIWSQ